MPDLEATLSLDTAAADAAVTRPGARLDQVLAKAGDVQALTASALGPNDDSEPRGIEAAPPKVSLLSSAEDVSAEFDGTRWTNGFAFEPEGGALDLVEDYPWFWSCPGSATEARSEVAGAAWSGVSPGGIKNIPTAPETSTWRPFLLHTADPCITTQGMFGRDGHARARRLLEANLSRILENELWTGTRATSAGYPNDFLTSAPVALNGGAATGHVSALAELEQGYFDRDNRPGFIHATPMLVTLWIRNGLVKATPSGRRLETALGTTVVPGSGYPGTGTGLAADTHAQSWAYATGPVMILRTPVKDQEVDDAQLVAVSTNDRVVRAEAWGIAFWDGKVDVGVLVNHLVELS